MKVPICPKIQMTKKICNRIKKMKKNKVFYRNLKIKLTKHKLFLKNINLNQYMI